jgi:hypothetical protein
LQQAFLNLALNACQAMPAGGTLRILRQGLLVHAGDVRTACGARRVPVIGR